MIDEWKELIRVNTARTRALQVGLQATLTLAEWLGILDHFQWRCAYCSGSFDVLEHIISIRDKGTTVANNVIPACFSCNGKKDRQGSKPNLEAIAKAQQSLNEFLAQHGPFEQTMGYIPMAEAMKELRIGRNRFFHYLEVLGISLQQFPQDHHKYIALTDLQRIQETIST